MNKRPPVNVTPEAAGRLQPISRECPCCDDLKAELAALRAEIKALHKLVSDTQLTLMNS